MFEIECRIDNPAAEQRFSLPAWIPGQLSAARVRAHRRERRGQERPARQLPVEKVDSGTWLVRGAQRLAQSHGHDLRARPIRSRRVPRPAARLLQRAVRVPAARGPRPRADRGHDRAAAAIRSVRRLARARRRSSASRSTSDGFGKYRAADYDELLDHPVEIGDFESVEFEAAGVPHHLVDRGPVRVRSRARRGGPASRSAKTQIDFFGRPAPFDRYWFLVPRRRRRRLGRPRASRVDEPDLRPRRPAEGRRAGRAARLSALPRAREPRVLPHVAREAHEARRVRSVSARPAQLHAPALGVRRHHELLPGGHAAAQRRARRRRVPAAARRGAHARLPHAGPVQAEPRGVELRRVGHPVSPRANHPNTTISYYTKGALVALALDLTMRRDSGGQDVASTTCCASSGSATARAASACPRTASSRSRSRSAASSLRGFFDARDSRHARICRCTELLAEFGVALELRAATGPDDKGGTRARRERRAARARHRLPRARARGSSSRACSTAAPAAARGLEPRRRADRDRPPQGERAAILKRRLTRFESGRARDGERVPRRRAHRGGPRAPSRAARYVLPRRRRAGRRRTRPSAAERGSASDRAVTFIAAARVRADSRGRRSANDRARAQIHVGVSAGLRARQPRRRLVSTAASTSASSAAATRAARTRCEPRASGSRSGSWSSTSARASSPPP